MQSAETPASEPSSSQPRHDALSAFRRPVTRTMLLTQAGVLAALAKAPPAPRSLPTLPDGTPPSIALKAVKACGNPHASYKRHVGPRQVERAQRQAARKAAKDARRA